MSTKSKYIGNKAFPSLSLEPFFFISWYGLPMVIFCHTFDPHTQRAKEMFDLQTDYFKYLFCTL